MSRKEKIHALVHECATELLGAVRERERLYQDRWVPAAELKESLELNFIPYPKDADQHGAKGWLFAILARLLEDRGAIEYKRVGSRSFCRSIGS